LGPPQIKLDPLSDVVDPLQELHFAVFETDIQMLSRHYLRLDFDQVTLIQHGTTFAAVTAILREALSDGDTTECVFSDSDEIHPYVLIRARFPVANDETNVGCEPIMLHRFYQQIIEPIRLHGVVGVNHVFIQEDRRQAGLMLVTDGRDMNAMMNIVSSQAHRCYCNHPMEVLRVLGVEAARQSIIIEIRKVYKHYGM
jgi:hypothetical protein